MFVDLFNNLFAPFDYALLEFYHFLVSVAGGIVIPISLVFHYIGENGLFGLLLAVVLSLFKRTRKAALAMVIALAVAVVATTILKPLVARPRPYLSGVFDLWWREAGAICESGYSFPSGHTLGAMSTMAALALSTFKRHKWIIAPTAAYVLLMAISRNCLVVHYPSDTAISILLGAFIATAGYFLAKAMWLLLERLSHLPLFAFVLSFDLGELILHIKQKKSSSESGK